MKSLDITWVSETVIAVSLKVAALSLRDKLGREPAIVSNHAGNSPCTKLIVISGQDGLRAAVTAISLKST